jgi:hypothetical protein
MGLALVQDYDKDPGFCGIVYDSRGDNIGYNSCDWNGKMNSPPCFAGKYETNHWIHLHDDTETKDAFVGETKIEDGVLWGKVFWENE